MAYAEPCSPAFFGIGVGIGIGIGIDLSLPCFDGHVRVDKLREGGPDVLRRKYDQEFKQNAVELLLSSGKGVKPLARDLGVGAVALRKWRDRYLRVLEDPSQGPPRGPAPREMADELRHLRTENETLKRQREILKKALGILSEQSPGSMP